MIALVLVNPTGETANPSCPPCRAPLVTAPPLGVLDVGETWTYTCSVTPDFSMFASDGLTSTAGFTATGPTGNVTQSAVSTAYHLQLSQTVSPLTYTGAGQQLTFTVTVKNPGGGPLTNVNLTGTFSYYLSESPYPEPVAVLVRTDVDATPTVLNVGETWTYTITHETTESDVSEGGLTSTADFTATGSSGNVTGTAYATALVPDNARDRMA